jgi:hypothetical protein
MTHTTQSRRIEPRSLTAALIHLADRHAGMPAVLEDLSPSGASIYVDRKLVVGAEVTLIVGDITCTGTVKHLEACDESFLVGLQFQKGKWPEPISYPIHFIKPSDTTED